LSVDVTLLSGQSITIDDHIF